MKCRQDTVASPRASRARVVLHRREWVLLPALALLTGLAAATSALGQTATPPAPVLATPPASDPASDVVGSTHGEVSVDQQGNMQYRVPLQAPHGRGGFTPSLSLTYNSGAGDGVLGTGWQIEGTSQISVCRGSVEHGDGPNSSGPLSFHPATDKYCLDGQRLVLVSGTHGAQGAVYRTEIDSQSRIVIQDVQSACAGSETWSVPRTFVIYAKDGTVHRYGGAAAQLLYAPGGSIKPYVLAWAQYQIADSNNNTLNFNYSFPTTGFPTLTSCGQVDNTPALPSLNLDSITYVGGEIDFSYSDRSPDSRHVTTVGTAQAVQSKWLDRIDVKLDAAGGGTALRRYNLTRQPSAENPATQHLTELQECNGSVCYPSLKFSWVAAATNDQPTSGTAFGGFDIGAVRYGDIDGDGRTDVVWLADGKDFRIGHSEPTSAGLNFVRRDCPSGASCPIYPLHADNVHGWQLIDFNGDGRSDLLTLEPNAGNTDYQWAVWLSDGTRFATKVSNLLSVNGNLQPMSLDNSFGNSASYLADFDGDGLPDLLVAKDGGIAPAIYLFKPTGNAAAPYAFQGPYYFNSDSGACTINGIAPMLVRPADFDGDGRADLLVQINSPTPCYPGQAAGASNHTSSSILQVFYSRGTSPGTMNFHPGTYWPVNEGTAGSPASKDLFLIGDFNGDGMADVAYGANHDGGTTGSGWAYQLNLGNGFAAPKCLSAPLATVPGGCPSLPGMNQAQLGDFDGDGQADFWVPTNASGSPYNVYLWNGSDFSSVPTPTPLFARDTSATLTWGSVLEDFDGDGYVDSLAMKRTDGNFEAHRIGGHHWERNVISQIETGLGALTKIDYAPLTLNSVYYREYNGASMISGWGSAVQDALIPRYVVQYLHSTAPTDTAGTNESFIRYLYAGYRMQGGGRGALGFHKVYSVDQQTGLETVSTYNQAFPLTGTPASTLVYTNGPTAADACLSAPDQPSCMTYFVAPDIGGGQVQISNIADAWDYQVLGAASLNTPLGGPAPIFLAQSANASVKFDLDGTLLSTMGTSYTYNAAYGELTASTSNEYNAVPGSNASLVRQTTTAQQYADVDVPPSAGNGYTGTWHIGRLSRSSVSVAGFGRDGVASTPVPARVTSYVYDATTGQLTEEHIQPGGSADQALVKYHQYDTYGNEVRTVNCSESAACSPSLAAAGMTFQSSDPNWVQRYGRVAYDSRGIFPNVTYAPFIGSGSAAIEATTSTVTTRNAFGDPTAQTDLNGLHHVAAYGSLGRQYFTADDAGSASLTRYRWCDGYGRGTGATVHCPSGAAYRVETTTDTGTGGVARAPATWTYYDALERVVLSLRQGFAAGQFSAVSTGYDNLGRVIKVSEPYFTADPNGASAPGASTALCGSSLYCTQTGYDVLGRVVSVRLPNAGITTNAYGHNSSGMPTSTTTLPANNAGAPNYAQTTVTVFNRLGQPLSTIDALGSPLLRDYDAAGNLVGVSRSGYDGKSASTIMGYDALGRKTSLSDPDAGNWSYRYNALGEDVGRASDTTCQQILRDGQGRQYSRGDYFNNFCGVVADTTASWTYDRAAHGLGQINTIASDDHGTSYRQQASYDAFGRPLRQTINIADQGVYSTYFQNQTYDAYGRLFQKLFEGGGIPQTGELYQYNSNGHTEVVRDAELGLTGTIYRQVLTMDARGNVTSEQRAGNAALQTTRSYRADTGWLSDIVSANGAVQRLHYDYDMLGNVVGRHDTSGVGPSFTANVHETYQYDVLQRQATGMQYDSLGNVITTASGIQYQYGAYPPGNTLCIGTNIVTPGPDAVSGFNGNTYCYDSHGNQVRTYDPGNPQGSLKRQLWYTSYDQLRGVELKNPQIQHTTTYSYGAARERLLRADFANATASGTPSTVLYLGDAEIATPASGGTRVVKRYLPGLILSQNIAADGSVTTQYEYLFGDNLGSTHRITDAAGTLSGTNGAEAWNPWGAREDARTGAAVADTYWYNFDSSLTRHGFTGHEAMDETGLIHMNGRVYDPRLQRFVQADPLVNDPADLQSYNRYTYVLNNPLTHTDPSGYWGRRQQGYVRMAAAIVITAYTGFCYSQGAWAAMAGTTQNVVAVVAAGTASGFITSGNLKGAVLGGLSAGVNYGIGSGLEGMGEGAHVAVHALAGGVLQKLQGGSFGHGFVTAGLSEAATPLVSGTSTMGNGIRMALVGGTVSALTGDKFSNGAISSAFQYAFNDALHLGFEWLNRDIGASGLEFLKEKEGWNSNLYNDSGNNATIGYGHLVHMGPVNGHEDDHFKLGITKEEGEELLRSDVSKAVHLVNSKVNVPVTQTQFDALVIFAFNVNNQFSTSTALRSLNAGNYQQVGPAMRMFNESQNRQGQKVLDFGLVNRRNAESLLFYFGH